MFQACRAKLNWSRVGEQVFRLRNQKNLSVPLFRFDSDLAPQNGSDAETSSQNCFLNGY